MANGESAALLALKDEWHKRDRFEPEWELRWVDRLREAVPDPEHFVIVDDAIVPKADLPWGIPVYRFGRADDAMGMVWWADKPDVRGLEAYGTLHVYLLDPVAVLASWVTPDGARTWIVDTGLMSHEEISPL